MAAYVAGDAAAFRALFQRYAPFLLGLLRRDLRRPADAEDLVQQTFLHLHRARRDFRTDAKLRPYLVTIALNLKREYFRRKGRRPEEPLELNGRRDPAQDPPSLTRKERAKQVREALEHLSEGQREAIELHWFAGLSFPEVATALGTSLSAVKVRAHRGYKRLREILSEQTLEKPKP
jgi:RNA polymerase sigma-70 factor (ECF subfamily)